VLEGDFHEACYGAAWKLKDVSAQQEGWRQVEARENALPVHAGMERAEMVGIAIEPEAIPADNLSE